MNLNLIINKENKDKINQIKDKVVIELNEYIIKDLSFIVYNYCCSYDYYNIYIYKIGILTKDLQLICDENNSILSENENYYHIQLLTEENFDVTYDYEININLYWWKNDFNLDIKEEKKSVVIIDSCIEMISRDLIIKYEFDYNIAIDIDQFIIKYKDAGFVVWDFYEHEKEFKDTGISLCNLCNEHEKEFNLNRIFINKTSVSMYSKS